MQFIGAAIVNRRTRPFPFGFGACHSGPTLLFFTLLLSSAASSAAFKNESTYLACAKEHSNKTWHRTNYRKNQRSWGLFCWSQLHHSHPKVITVLYSFFFCLKKQWGEKQNKTKPSLPNGKLFFCVENLEAPFPHFKIFFFN